MSLIAVVASAALAVVAPDAAGSGSAGGVGRRCAGSVAASSHGIRLDAFAFRARNLKCSAAHAVVRAYLHKKLDDRTETCAGRAVTPPFLGCHVDGYLCKATAVPEPGAAAAPEECLRGRRRVAFRERDSDHG